MDVRIVKFGQITIAEVEGRIDGRSAEGFATKVISAIPRPQDGWGLICDMTNVPYVSSAGLRAVLVIAKQLSKQKSGFSVCGADQNVSEVFRISGFHKIISIYESREEALAKADGA